MVKSVLLQVIVQGSADIVASGRGTGGHHSAGHGSYDGLSVT